MPAAARFAMYRIALARKLTRALGGDFDPYPKAPGAARLSPSAANRAAAGDPTLALSWHGGDPLAWQNHLRAKLKDLMGVPAGDGVPTVTHQDAPQTDTGGRTRQRWYLRAFAEVDVAVDIVWPGDAAGPLPVMLCLQGTNSGAHLSWAEARMPPDPVKIASGLDFAHQAVARGYAAVCIEQRCFGLRREQELDRASADPCVDAFHHALLFGRTLLGDRVGDVLRVIDWLANGGAGLDLDLARLHALGHSAGGTVALHAAALDDRIGALIASGCVGPIRDTLLARGDRAGQNTIPGQLNWFELADVVALCAPRPVLAVSGVNDHIFPSAGVEKVVADATAVYEALGAGDQLVAVAQTGGHRFDQKVIWPAFETLLAD
ncbi:MAG: alpha/beta hydrolase family protein [Alphaproteobacteria bacterium]